MKALVAFVAVLGLALTGLTADPPAPDVAIDLGSRQAQGSPTRMGFSHTGGGNIDVQQPSADTVVLTMTGVAVAGGHPVKDSLAALAFNLSQEFEVKLAKPEIQRARLTLEARVIGLLRSHTKSGGYAGITCPAHAAVVPCGIDGLALVEVGMPGRSVAAGENLSVNDKVGPAAVDVPAGRYALHQVFGVQATHPKSLWPCKAASAEFAPDPALDPLWISAFEPFRGAQKKDFGFQVILKVSAEGAGAERCDSADGASYNGARFQPDRDSRRVMRRLPSRTWWMVLPVWAIVAEFLRGDAAHNASSDRIAALILQLGDSTFARRVAAGKQLEALGEPALPALRKAAVASDDAEIRLRARQLVRTIMVGGGKSRSTGLKLVTIDGGEFSMGSPKNETGRRPDEAQRRVTITEPFLLGAYEVTQAEYEQVMTTNPSWFARTGNGKNTVVGQDTTRFPVENISWYDAIEFCNRLSQQDGYAPYYQLADVQLQAGAILWARVTIVGGNGYRLPTEAEWEYACRAGTNTAFHFGGSNSGREANLKPGPAIGYGIAPSWPTLERTTKVGSYRPNAWGLYDMHGNAAEWCWDWYDADYSPGAPTDDPHGPEKGNHLGAVRSGSWLVNERSCRSASRFLLTPGDRSYHVGFRVARTP